MLVLESTSVNSRPASSSSAGSMLTPGGNQQYIQPDYLSPLPTTLDAKRSPLALLAQTCSQIGADPSPASSTKACGDKSSSSVNKKEMQSSDNSGKSSKTPPASSTSSSSSSSSSASMKHESSKSSEESGHSASAVKSGFKSPGVHSSSSSSSGSKSGSHSHSNSNSSSNSSHHHSQHHSQRVSQSSPTSASGNLAAVAESNRTTEAATSKLMEGHRAALDALQGLSKDIPLGTYRPHFPPMSGLPSAYGGLDAATAAALGLSVGVPGGFRHPYPPMSGMSGYPPVSLGLSLAGYQALNYGRMKATAAGSAAESLMSGMPVCRDPYCTGCPSSMAQQLAMASAANASPGGGSIASIPSSLASAPSTAGVCPAGCTQCDHQKLASATSSSTTTTPTSTSPFSPSSASMASMGGSNAARPYVCNWIAGDNYCGKRFTSSEELLQHLRTHTSLAIPALPTSAETPGSVSAAAAAYSSLLNPSLHPHSHLLASSSAMHRTYPTPPLSPLSMARYHPYSKPPTASPLSTPPNPLANPLLSLGSPSQLGSLNSLAALSGHNPLSAYAAAAAATPMASHPTLGAYYSHPYSLYSQRLGAGVLP